MAAWKVLWSAVWMVPRSADCSAEESVDMKVVGLVDHSAD